MPRRRPDLFRAGYAIRDGAGGVIASNPLGNEWFYKQSELGGRSGNGKNPDEPNDDFEALLALVADGDTIYVRGKVTGNFTAPAGICDVSVVGASTAPRHGSASNTSEMGAASFFATSSSTELFIIHCQGWRFANLLFSCPTTNAAIEIQSDGAATPEKTGGNLQILDCRFSLGKYAIECNGGSGFVTVKGCSFEGQTTTSIVNTSTANALPLGWVIEDNKFGHASATHIDAPFSKSVIKNNTFATVASTAKYIDLTSGANNVVTGNTLGGVYNTDDYVAGTSDLWLGNWVTVISTQAPNGFTILAPAAP